MARSTKIYPGGYPVSVQAGGQLITELSSDNVGADNWVQKLNFRRFKDQEIRCEGWIKFKPNAAGSNTQATFDGTETVLLLAECVRPNGQRVVVGCSNTKVKKFDTGTYTWTDITGGLTFTTPHPRWQATTLNGYLVLNNGVDLPVAFRVEWAAIQQLQEMRQVGIAAVGRITEFNGFLCLGNITEVQADQLNPWMVGYSNFAGAGPTTENSNFNVTSGNYAAGQQFNVTTGSSTITASLPAFSPNPDPTVAGWVWLKKVDSGSGTVVTSPAIGNQTIVLKNQGDMALLWSNGTNWSAKYFPLGVIPATDPYGAVPSDIVNVVSFEFANSTFGDPTNWAPLYSVWMTAASATINLPMAPPSSWVANQTRVAVINGGPSGGVLGGDTAHPEGILITAINGRALTLEISTDTGNTYPGMVQVTRWTDTSTLVARYRLQGDGSPIIGMQALGDLLILYRTTCIFTGRYTGNVPNPFLFTARYPSKEETMNLPIWGDCIANINGAYHLYPGVGGRFYQFDGVSWPTIHEVCDNAASIFFNGTVDTDECFCVTNPLTKNIWFCSTTNILAYDLEFGSCGQMDVALAGASYVMRPASTDMWFIIAIGGSVYTYGLVRGAVPIHTWLRDGVVPAAKLKSGLINFGDPSNEKLVLSYTPILSSQSGSVNISVQIYTTYNPNKAGVAQMSPAANLPDASGNNFITTYFQAIYFQDEIDVVDTGDVDCRISQRIYEPIEIGTGRGITRQSI